MNYQVGQAWTWVPRRSFEEPQDVTVIALLPRGNARLSNGWTVDADGFADGTPRQPGGHVVPRDTAD